MEREETKAKFDKAKALYSTGQYEESLAILIELNRIYPVTKNVLFPMALSLRALHRYDEALAICEEVILNFDAEKAHNLRRQLELDIAAAGGGFENLGQTADLLGDVDAIGPVEQFGAPGGSDGGDAGGLDLVSLNAVSDEPVGSTAPVVTRGGGPNWGVIFAVGLCLAGMLFLGSIVYFVASGAAQDGSSGQEGTSVTPNFDGLPVWASMLIWVGSFLFGWGAQALLCFLTLMFTQNMPEHTLNESLKNIGMTSLVMMLLGFIPVLGGIIGLFYFVNKYQLGFGGCVVYLVIGFVLMLAMLFLAIAVFAAIGISLDDIETAAATIRHVDVFLA